MSATETTNGEASSDVLSEARAIEIARQAGARRKAACIDELNAALARHGCALLAIPAIVEGKIVANIEVVPR